MRASAAGSGCQAAGWCQISHAFGVRVLGLEFKDGVVQVGAGERFQFSYDYCKGCALCAAECPCGAIKMPPEEI